MLRIQRKTAVMAATLFLLGTGTGWIAQSQTRPYREVDAQQRQELARADLTGPHTDQMEVIVSLAEYQPGDTLGRHRHHGLEAAYVAQGATVQVPGKAPMRLETGASVLHLRDVQHGGFQVVGNTALKLFTVHVVDKGTALYDYGE